MRSLTIFSVLVLFQAANAGYSGSVPNGSSVPRNSNCSVASKPAGAGVGCILKPAAPAEKAICSSPHGAHFNGPIGTIVLATGPGVVEKVGSNSNLGTSYVVINHSANVKTS